MQYFGHSMMGFGKVKQKQCLQGKRCRPQVTEIGDRASVADLGGRGGRMPPLQSLKPLSMPPPIPHPKICFY